MERLFGQVDLAQRGVLVEKALHVEPLPKVQAVTVTQKQAADGVPLQAVASLDLASTAHRSADARVPASRDGRSSGSG
jgi:hypothetical protein